MSLQKTHRAMKVFEALQLLNGYRKATSKQQIQNILVQKQHEKALATVIKKFNNLKTVQITVK